MAREAIKYGNQIRKGSIEREAEKAHFLHEFLFYITEKNTQPTITQKIFETNSSFHVK